MKIVKGIIIGIVGLIALLAVVGFFLPREIHVERSAYIEAPPAEVFRLVNDMREFNSWSPWHELDPNAVYTYDGPPAGVGAKMSWASDDPNVGSGTSEIITSEPNRLIRTQLDFGEQGEAVAFYRLEPQGSGTQITWGFDTDMGGNPFARYFGLMMDSWVGRDYEKGLAKLKTVAES